MWRLAHSCFVLTCVFLVFPFLATLLANCRFSVRTCWIDEEMRAMLFSFYLHLKLYLIYSSLWILSKCQYKTVLGRAILILSNLQDMWILHGLENSLCRLFMRTQSKKFQVGGCDGFWFVGYRMNLQTNLWYVCGGVCRFVWWGGMTHFKHRQNNPMG